MYKVFTKTADTNNVKRPTPQQNMSSLEVIIESKGSTMILEYKVNEIHVEPAWLKTLYDLIEELNCKCKTYIDETYNRTYKQFSRTRIIEVYGSDTMLSWLKLRMERYNHFIDALNERPEIQASMREEDDNEENKNEE